MPQATARRASARRDAAAGDELGALVEALYDVANGARRATTGDPVEQAGMRVLVWVRALGSPRLSELATGLRLDLSTVSRHVRGLAADGFVVVARDAEDGRAQRVSLTDAGREAIDTVVENRRTAIGDVVSHWPATDRAQLTTLLRRLADDMKHDRTDDQMDDQMDDRVDDQGMQQ